MLPVGWKCWTFCAYVLLKHFITWQDAMTIYWIILNTVAGDLFFTVNLIRNFMDNFSFSNFSASPEASIL